MTSFYFDFLKISTEKREGRKDEKNNLLQANPKFVITIFMSNTKHDVETLMKVLKYNHCLKFFSPSL